VYVPITKWIKGRQLACYMASLMKRMTGDDCRVEEKMNCYYAVIRQTTGGEEIAV
jgi:hypothetical protein